MNPMNKCCHTCCYPRKNSSKVQIDSTGNNWYSQENIDRVWNQGRYTGIFLMCHQTDPHASDYGGKDSKRGFQETHACVGFAFFVYMHVRIWGSVNGNTIQYQAIVGEEVAMSQKAIAETILSFRMGRSALLGGMYLPTELKDDPDQLQYPTGFEKTRAAFKLLPDEEANQ
jgi:hypothetical protein